MSHNLVKIKSLFLKSMFDGWSVPVSISKAGMSYDLFRRYFRDDPDVIEAVKERNKHQVSVQKWVR